MESLKLSGMALPPDSAVLRDLPSGRLGENEQFCRQYDRHTLFYDAFFDEERKIITLVGPGFKSTFSWLLKRGRFKVDGEFRDHRIIDTGPRTGVVEVDCPAEDPKTIRFLCKGLFFHRMHVRKREVDRFAGKNAIVAISKNNNLVWIKDWLKYYVEEHGTNAVVLFDNGSDAYGIEELRSAVGSVKGIQESAVISAPYPFGPTGNLRGVPRYKFFHLSMFHIGHLRFLAKANAVLAVDIDELVNKPRGVSVYEEVKKTPLGFLSIMGSWRYSIRTGNEKSIVRHVDHKYKRIGEDAWMNPKWCVDPQGPLKGKYWRVHGVVGAERDHSLGFEYPLLGANPPTSSRSRFSVNQRPYVDTLWKMSRSRVEGSFSRGYRHALFHRQPLCFLPPLSHRLVDQVPLQGPARRYQASGPRYLPPGLRAKRRRYHPWRAIR